MDTLNLRIAYRPLRIGWCIRTDVKEDLREALHLTHTLWGGRYNPLIPINNPSLANKLIDLFRVDALYPIAEDIEVKHFIEKYPYLPWPMIWKKLFIESDNKKLPTILDVYHPIRHLYERKSRDKINICMYEWSESDPLSDVFLATFGHFPEGDLSSQYTKILGNFPGLEKVTLNKGEVISEDIFNKITLNRITGINLKYYPPFSWDNPGFYVGDSENTEDILTYWNLRASTADLLFYDLKYSDQFELIKRKHLEIVQNRPKHPHDFKNSTAVWSLSRSRGKLDLTPFGKRVSQCSADETVWNGLNIKPPKVFFNDDTVLASVSISTPPRISFQLPSKPFFIENKFHTQYLVISLKVIVDLPDEEFTFMVPNLPVLNEYFGRNSYFIWHMVRIENDGLGIIINLTQDSLSLSAVKSQDLIENIFLAYGIKAKSSPAGLLGRRLIKQMGSIQGCRVFKIKGVRSLIERYNPYQSFTRSAANMIIGDNDPKTNRPNFKNYENLVITYDPTRKKLTPDKAFTYLVEKGVFRVGLKLNCTHCELDFWKHLDDVKTNTICEFCGSNVNVSTQLKDRDWAYRRSGIFGREDHLEGGVPVAVTLQQLHTAFHQNIIAYSTALELSPGSADIKKCETDIAILTNGHDGKAQLIIGECKTHSEISQQDVENMIKVAEAFPSDRIDVFILFSKLSQFTPEEIERIKKTRIEFKIQNEIIYQDRAIMLTDRELEPYFVYQQTAKEFQIDQYAIGVKDMVRNSASIFLNPIPIDRTEIENK